MSDSSLFIPVILGTSHQGRQSEHVAKFIVEQVALRDRLETELIDIRNIAIVNDDAGEPLKDTVLKYGRQEVSLEKPV